MVISRSSPPSTSFSGDCASCSTSAGDMYWRRPSGSACAAAARGRSSRDQRQIDRRRRQQRIGEIDQQPVPRIEISDVPTSAVANAAPSGDQRDRPEQRRERDHQQSEQKRGGEFDGDAVVRLRDHLAGQRGLEHLGMDFHAGHGARNRRGLDVVEADRRRADEHQLAGDHVGRDVLSSTLMAEHRSRHRCGRMDPELAIMVGRNLEALDADALDAGRLGRDQDRAGAGGHAQHLERQRRHGLALRQHDHRHPPHDAVALGLDREQAAPGGGCSSTGTLRSSPGKSNRKRCGPRPASRAR